MPLAMLLTLVGVLLSAVLASIMAVQIDTSRRAVQSARALDAALTGLDVAVGHIRFANDGSDPTGLSNAGVLAELPCAPFTGRVGVGGTAGYRVTIGYRDKTGGIIACLPFGGADRTPTTAVLEAVGTASTSSRTLTATYTFRTTNKNVPGGLIPVYQTTSKNLCLDAGSGVPTRGAYLRVQPCSPDSDQQTFAYHPNLTIMLVSSASAGMPLGMCLDAGPVPHTSSTPVTFQPCASTTQPRQQWGYNDNANFEGTSDGQGLDGYCFNISSPDVGGSSVVVRKGGGACYRQYNNVSSFTPEASVGAGAAAASTNQMVNYGQFGRCLDVTETNVNYKYLIVWPCKQAPDPTRISWNQKWTRPLPVGTAVSATGLISTKPSTTKCLKSPLSSSVGLFVTLVDCPAVETAATRWTVYGFTGVYATSYTIVDDAGNCLSATDPAATPAREMYPRGSKVSPVIVVACTGSSLEKWNADPDVLKATPLRDIAEK
jgi:hypothetical protein